jgi:hypothetical protein
MWSKTIAKTGEIGDIILEEMEEGLITAVKEVASCLMSLWRNLAYDLVEDMHIPSRLHNRNMSAGKMSNQFKVTSGIMFVKCRIQNCCAELPSGVMDSLRPGGVRCVEEEVTQTHTHTPYQQSLIITQQQSLTQCQNCVTVLSVDWLQEQQEVLKVKYWLYSWERSKQTEWKTEKQAIKRGRNNRLQTVTDTLQGITDCKLSLTHNRT